MEQVKLKMLQLKRQLTSLTIEANAYEDVLSRTSSEAERISKLLEDYQYQSRFNSSGSEDGSTDGDSSSDFGDLTTAGGAPKYSASSNRVKRASRMKARRNSVHEIKIV